MTINGRLLLLVVATGLFVRVWTANNSAHYRNHPRTPRNQVTVISSPISAGKTVAHAVSYRPKLTTRPIAALEEVWTLSSCPIPLPAAIQNGTYRVVNDAGRVARLEVALSVAAAQNAHSLTISPEFYVAAIASERWYFIRLQAPVDLKSVAQAPENLPHNTVPAVTETSFHSPCSNRKFDFMGYVSAEGVKESAGGCSDVPEPPELPDPR